MLGDVSIEPQVALKLGRSGLTDVLAYLWAVDCQTCGRSIGAQVPSVCIDELDGPAGRGAVASVHHQSCRRSCWGASPERGLGSGQLTTYRAQCFLLTSEHFGDPPAPAARRGSPRPMMVVNPTLELIPLQRVADGSWSLMTNVHRYLGMRPPGEAALDRPITAGSVSTDRDAVHVRMARQVWSARGGSSVVDSIDLYGGITLVITSALGPDSPGLLNSTFSRKRYEMAWLRLSR